ncbi:MAG: hypothetical protein S4CHLAM102_01400 [Chlamydiia bacterium]|nr:hypothetical protein [Chlamydiia bacterium]
MSVSRSSRIAPPNSIGVIKVKGKEFEAIPQIALPGGGSRPATAREVQALTDAQKDKILHDMSKMIASVDAVYKRQIGSKQLTRIDQEGFWFRETQGAARPAPSHISHESVGYIDEHRQPASLNTAWQCAHTFNSTLPPRPPLRQPPGMRSLPPRGPVTIPPPPQFDRQTLPREPVSLVRDPFQISLIGRFGADSLEVYDHEYRTLQQDHPALFARLTKNGAYDPNDPKPPTYKDIGLLYLHKLQNGRYDPCELIRAMGLIKMVSAHQIEREDLTRADKALLYRWTKFAGASFFNHHLDYETLEELVQVTTQLSRQDLEESYDQLRDAYQHQSHPPGYDQKAIRAFHKLLHFEANPRNNFTNEMIALIIELGHHRPEEQFDPYDLTTTFQRELLNQLARINTHKTDEPLKVEHLLETVQELFPRLRQRTLHHDPDYEPPRCHGPTNKSPPFSPALNPLVKRERGADLAEIQALGNNDWRILSRVRRMPGAESTYINKLLIRACKCKFNLALRKYIFTELFGRNWSAIDDFYTFFNTECTPEKGYNRNCAAMNDLEAMFEGDPERVCQTALLAMRGDLTRIKTTASEELNKVVNRLFFNQENLPDPLPASYHQAKAMLFSMLVVNVPGLEEKLQVANQAFREFKEWQHNSPVEFKRNSSFDIASLVGEDHEYQGFTKVGLFDLLDRATFGRGSRAPLLPFVLAKRVFKSLAAAPAPQ